MSFRHALRFAASTHTQVLVAAELLLLSANRQSFVDQNSEQPATKSAFVFELRRTARCYEPTILHGVSRPFRTAEHATCYEVEEPITARKPIIEYRRVL